LINKSELSQNFAGGEMVRFHDHDHVIRITGGCEVLEDPGDRGSKQLLISMARVGEEPIEQDGTGGETDKESPVLLAGRARQPG